MRSKALLAAGIMVSLISLISGALIVMLRLVTVSTSRQPDSSSAAGWLSLLGLAAGLAIAIYGGRKTRSVRS